MAFVTDRITVDPTVWRMPVRARAPHSCDDVLDLLAAGLPGAQVLDERPDLEPDDIRACLQFASRRLDHPIVAA